MIDEYTKNFAAMLRGVAARLESGDLELFKARQEAHLDPLAPTEVSFTVQPPGGHLKKADESSVGTSDGTP